MVPLKSVTGVAPTSAMRVERERGREETDQVDEQTGGKSEYWVVFVTIASDEHATLFKLAHGAAVVMTGEGW